MQVVRKDCDTGLDLDAEILHKWSHRKIQAVQKNLNAEILRKWSYGIGPPGA